jgi:DNA polymerase-1
VNARDPVQRFWNNFKLLLRIVGEPVSKVIWCMDGDSKTFRHKKYLPYKAQRPEKTQEFIDFKAYIEKELKQKFIVALNNEYEADDCIAYLAKTYRGKVFIASADLDQSQLVGDNIKMLKVFNQNSYEHVDENYVVHRYGIYPVQIPELKALAGDKSDNIKLPIRGIGGIKAAMILLAHGSIDGMYDAIEDGTFLFPKIADELLTYKKLVYLFLELTSLDKEVPGIIHLLDK